MQLSSCAASHAAIKAETRRPVPLNRAAYFLLVLRCDRSFHTTGSGRSGGDGISVSAIAASFQQPFETARRHANALIEDGLCERRGLRIRIRRQMFESPHFQHLLADLHDIMTRMIDQLRADGVPLPEERERPSYNPLATVAAAIDLTLAAYEYGAPHYASWLQMRVISAIFCANSRRITIDSGLTHQFAYCQTIPPDDLLVPVSSVAVARALNLSVATARRQIRSAIDDSLLKRVGDGVIRTRTLLDMIGFDLCEAASQRALKTIERLAPEGFRFGDPASHYLSTRPMLVDFD